MTLKPALAAALALALATPAAPAFALRADQSLRVDLGATAGPKTVSIPNGRSMIIDLPVDARDVLVSNPKVADVVLRSPRRLYVLGVGSGQTDAVFFDGTLFEDDEMIRAGAGAKTGRRMGHVPINGPDGSLARLASLPGRRIFFHINNTNPILLKGSPERRQVEAGVVEVEDHPAGGLLRGE